MAIILTAWEHDGNGQAAIDCLRVDRLNDETMNKFIEQYTAYPRTVLITKDRSDKQSHVETILYQRKGYIDPCQQ